MLLLLLVLLVVLLLLLLVLLVVLLLLVLLLVLLPPAAAPQATPPSKPPAAPARGKEGPYRGKLRGERRIKSRRVRNGGLGAVRRKKGNRDTTEDRRAARTTPHILRRARREHRGARGASTTPRAQTLGQEARV